MIKDWSKKPLLSILIRQATRSAYIIKTVHSREPLSNSTNQSHTTRIAKHAPPVICRARTRITTRDDMKKMVFSYCQRRSGTPLSTLHPPLSTLHSPLSTEVNVCSHGAIKRERDSPWSTPWLCGPVFLIRTHTHTHTHTQTGKYVVDCRPAPITNSFPDPRGPDDFKYTLQWDEFSQSIMTHFFSHIKHTRVKLGRGLLV